MTRVGALLLMGGEGRRFGSDTPKQFHLLAGKKIFTYALETMRASRLFDEIVLVCHPDWRVECEGTIVTTGGATRQQSSYCGLMAFRKRPDIVLIHDAVRPFVSEEILRENVRLAREFGAVDTCIPSADTLVHAPDGRMIAAIPSREEYQRGQTPQTFKYEWIMQAHERALIDGIENASDDCLLVLRLGCAIHVARGSENNLKITSELDLFMAEQMLALHQTRRKWNPLTVSL